MLYTSILQFNKYFSPGSVSAHQWGFSTLNPSQQIQLDAPRSGRGAAIHTKGIIDTIKLFTVGGGGVVLNLINKYTSHSQSALRTKLMMIKVTLHWKAKGGPAFTDVAGGDVWEC